jgi:hypothetical protein
MHRCKQLIHHHHLDHLFERVLIDVKQVQQWMNMIVYLINQLMMILMNHQLNVRRHLLEKQQQRSENSQLYQQRLLQVQLNEHQQVFQLVQECHPVFRQWYVILFIIIISFHLFILKPKAISTTQSNSDSGTILVTNLQPSVTEEDVIVCHFYILIIYLLMLYIYRNCLIKLVVLIK